MILMHVCMYAYICIYVCVCVCVCLYVSVYIYNMYKEIASIVHFLKKVTVNLTITKLCNDSSKRLQITFSISKFRDGRISEYVIDVSIHIY